MASLKNQPEFEQMTDTATEENDMTATTTTTTTTRAEQSAAASVAATTAIAKAATTSVGAARQFKVAFAEHNNVFDTPTVEGLSLAAPRIKGEQGSLFKGADNDLGASIQFEIVSFNHRWAIGSGEDDKEAKDFFRVSYDNQTISGSGESVQAYVESLKAQGFDKANVSPYLDIFGFVTWTEKNGHIAPENRELCCLQCSKTSMGNFTAFATTQGLLQAKGLTQPTEVIEVHAEKRASGTNKYTNFSFHMPKAK